MASRGKHIGIAILVLLLINVLVYITEFKFLTHTIMYADLLNRHSPMLNISNVSHMFSVATVSNLTIVLQKDVNTSTYHVTSDHDNKIRHKSINNETSQIKLNPDFECFSSDLPSTYVSSRHVKDINCAAILTGSTKEITKADKLTIRAKNRYDPNLYIKITSNCTEFIKKRGYIMDSLTKQEEDFPVAFSIIMYKDIVQSERLLRAIYRPQNYYCIHVDSKTPDFIYTGMIKIASCFENVFVSEKRYNVIWGTISVILPELHCMDILWSHSKKWKYFINLTGQEFPLQTNLQLVKTLQRLNGSNSINGVKNHKQMYRWDTLEPPPHGITLTKGAVHIIATRGYVDFVLHDQRASDFLLWTNQTRVPDETFFSSLNHNTFLNVPGAYGDITSSNYSQVLISRFKMWLHGSMRKLCKGRVLRNICVFGTGDLQLLASRTELFANKFIFGFKQYGHDCLEELHFNRTRDEYIAINTSNSGWFSQFLSDMKYG
ncbi:Beta-1 [Mactra antiquata]